MTPVAGHSKPQLHGKPTDPISHRHREWGAPALASDIDLILIEWGIKRGIVALVEYKLGLDRKLPDTEARSALRIGELGERAEVPAFLVKYTDQPWRFRVYPLNTDAEGSMPFGRGELITELRWVTFLYYLRGHDLPRELRATLDDELPA